MKYYNTNTLIKVLFLIVCFPQTVFLFGQMPDQDGQIIYGNEWIDYEKKYLRIPVGEDGWHSITAEQLELAGWDETELTGNHLVLYHNGHQIPIVVSTNGKLDPADPILFYGRKNRSGLEDFIFLNPGRQMLNPEYSLFSDTSVYFLTLDANEPKMRYQERIPNNSGSQVSTVWTETLITYSGQYYTQASQGIIDPDFNDLEGFATDFASSVSREIDLSDFGIAGDSVIVEIGAGTDLNTRNFSLMINGEKYKDYSLPSVQSATRLQVSLPVAKVGKSLEISLKVQGNNQRVALAYIRIQYQIPATKLSPDRANPFYLRTDEEVFAMSLPADISLNPVYNLTQSTFFTPTTNGSVGNYNLEGNPGDEFVLLGDPVPVSNVVPVSFINYLEQPFDYLIITSDRLRKEADQNDLVSEYANYRSSAEGGSYEVGIATIEQLRDQYIFGIEGHPYAIRNFIGRLVDEDHGVLLVNIIGKGMGYGYLRSAADFKKYHYRSHFVPTFGHYGSDNLLVAAKGETVPRIPVGRIPVTEPEEIGHYLEKVKTYESVLRNPEQVDDREWMKRVMHFNGGDRNIYATISNFMDNLGSQMQKDSFAAQLVSYYKSSFGSTDIPEREEIFSNINDGAALITFFGHSASSSLDFNIDIIEEYENQGRLPVFLALGCSSGNIFLPGKNLAEKFVLTPGVGSILFLSTATSEYLSNLQSLARNFYAEIGSDQYGKPLGNIVQKTLSGLGRFQKHLQSVFVFAGDPAIRAYHFDGPDFTFDTSSGKMTPERPSLVDESFTLEVDIQNMGLRHRDTFAVLLRQQLPDGRIKTLDTVWTNVEGFDRTLELVLPVTDDMEGKNTYFLTIDPDNRIEEYPVGAGESNNQWEQDGSPGFDVFIQNTTLQLIYPYDMAIVPDSRPVLEFFNGNVEGRTREYVIELDTTTGFDSPAHRSFSGTSKLARIDFPLEENLEEDVVYYWRARGAKDSVYTPLKSFVHISDLSGWNQSHFGQFQKDSLIDVVVNDKSMDFASLQNVYKLDHGHKKAAIIFNEIHRPRFFRSASPALNVSIFKPRKNTWVRNPKPGLYNSIWPVSGDDFLFTFVYRPYSKPHRQAIIDLIESEAEEGDYVIFWNTTDGSSSPKGETWAQDSIDNQGVNLFNFFEEKGASQIRALAEDDRRAYSLIYQKGGQVVTEILGDSAGVNIEYVNLNSFTNAGSIWSDKVDLLKTLQSWEAGAKISGRDSIEMVFQNGTQDKRIKFNANSEEVQTGMLDGMVGSEFFWKGDIFDLESRTFPSFYWRIFGEFRPDWRITNSTTQPLVDTAAIQSNELSVYFKIDHRGEIEADSVRVLVELFHGNRSLAHRFSVPVAQWGQDLHYTWPLSSDYNGTAVVKVTVDPDNEWVEAEENNNAVFRNFDIRGDRIAPTLEVLFDQQSILNGDIVAPNSLITVQLADFPNNNLTGNPDFVFEIKKPSGEVIKIDGTNPDLTTEVTDEGMELKYQSDFDENGLYELRVSVRDAAGNIQKSDFVIDFEVILENSVSAILPYPNPFVDAVRFAYTLTGRDEPEIFRIMIYTVSGRLVKEITKAEFGPMRIGRHLSEYVWDGRDNWNQDLAPGVYLYKVLSRDSEGAEYEKYQINELEEGNYFRNGIGKMVKLR